MRTAVVSGAYGEKYLRMADVTWPTQKAYADKIGASFHEITLRRYPGATPHWEKLQLRQFLGDFDRVLWLDCDVIVRGDCPNLFATVPEGVIGAWNEAPFGPWDYPSFVSKWASFEGRSSPPYPGWHLNSGVMVLSRKHAALFSDPASFPGYELLWDQGWLNYIAAREGTELMDIGWKFNHMFIAPPTRHESFVIHYCGTVNGSGYSKDIPPGGDYVDVIKNDLEIWRKRGLIQ
jgi:hypothetical protein